MKNIVVLVLSFACVGAIHVSSFFETMDKLKISAGDEWESLTRNFRNYSIWCGQNTKTYQPRFDQLSLHPHISGFLPALFALFSQDFLNLKARLTWCASRLELSTSTDESVSFF